MLDELAKRPDRFLCYSTKVYVLPAAFYSLAGLRPFGGVWVFHPANSPLFVESQFTCCEQARMRMSKSELRLMPLETNSKLQRLR